MAYGRDLCVSTARLRGQGMGVCSVLEGRAALAKIVIRKFVIRSENVSSDTF